MQLPSNLTTVTPFTKTLALLLYPAVFLLGLYIGYGSLPYFSSPKDTEPVSSDSANKNSLNSPGKIAKLTESNGLVTYELDKADQGKYTFAVPKALSVKESETYNGSAEIESANSSFGLFKLYIGTGAHGLSSGLTVEESMSTMSIIGKSYTVRKLLSGGKESGTLYSTDLQEGLGNIEFYWGGFEDSTSNKQKSTSTVSSVIASIATLP